MKVTLEYDLSVPSEEYAYKCSQRALEACQMLESLKAYTQGYTAYKGISKQPCGEAVLADIISDLSKWDGVKI